MSKPIQTTALFAVLVIAATLLTYVTAAQVTYAQNATVLQAKPADKGGDKGGKDKTDKEAKDKGGKDKGGKDKKPKVVQKVKITADIDGSQVENATDAFSAYTFTVQSGTFTSKAKQLEDINANTTEATLNFNGNLKVSAADGFTVTGVSDSEEYQTVVATGTFASKTQGNSGKTILEGSLSEPLTLQENAVEGLE